MTYKTKVCLKCGQEYRPTDGRQKYCIDCMFPVRNERRAERDIAKRKGYLLKKCQLCGKEYLPTSGIQKFCPECGPIIKAARSVKWAKDNPDKIKVTLTKYCKANLRKRSLASSNWAKENPERVSANHVAYKKENPGRIRAIDKKHRAKRRGLSYAYLNSWFEDSDGHHINKADVIYIPKAMHSSVRHNVWTGKGMAEINALAGLFLMEDWTSKGGFYG